MGAQESFPHDETVKIKNNISQKMGLLQWLFQAYVMLTIFRTADRWTSKLLTRYVYEESETLSFMTINFADCTGEHHRMCGNILRSEKPIHTGGYTYKSRITSFSLCRDVEYQFGMIGQSNVQWSRRAEPGGAFKVDNGKVRDDPFYGAREDINTPATGDSSSIKFAIWFPEKLNNETLHRCKTSEHDDPFLYWRYAVIINSPLTEWTGIEWFNIFTK